MSSQDENNVTYFGETDARNRKIRFGIKREDRSRHMYVIGKTGMGKSTLLENMAVQDIKAGEGMAFIDPHGKTAELLLEYIPESRKKDVVYFAPFDMEHPISFNVLEDVGADRRHLVVNGLMAAFKKIWVDAWSARMEYILNNIMLALLEFPGSTLLGVNRMLADKDFRNKVVANVTDPSVKSFWIDEYGKYSEKFAADAAPAIQNKVGQFISNPLVRNIIGQAKSTFDIRKIMDEKKILIINLSKGRVGEGNANLLGSMLVTKIYLAAMSRADLNESEMEKAAPFYLYVDEFQNFANESFADILSEARKYKLSLTIAHQYIEQVPEEVRAAVFGNVGTMVAFRVGATDAEVLEKEFVPVFTQEDLVNLGMFQIYLKLMIDKVSSRPFSANTMGPIAKPEMNLKDKIVEESRKQFSRPRAVVEEEIKNWHLQRFNDAPVGNGGGNRGGSVAGGGDSHVGASRNPTVSSGVDRRPSHPGSVDSSRRPQASAYQPAGVMFNAPKFSNTVKSGGGNGAIRSNNVGHNMNSRTEPSRVVTSTPRSAPAPSFTPSVDNRPIDTRPPLPSVSLGEAIRLAKLEHEKKEDVKQIDKNKKAEAENDLRQAISLSHLKSVDEKTVTVDGGQVRGEHNKNQDNKSAKPEQLSALRDVLVNLNTNNPKKPNEVPEDVLKRTLNVPKDF